MVDKNPSRPARSLAGTFTLMSLPGILVTAIVAWAIFRLTASPAMAIFAGSGAGLVCTASLAAVISRRPRQILDALSSGLGGLRAHDYSLRLVAERNDELGQMVEIFNQLSELLGRERGDLKRREILLQTVIEASPAAVLLIGAGKRVILANHAARVLFHHGRRLVGVAFQDVLDGCPDAFRRALETGDDTLATVEIDGEEESFHVTRRVFDLNTRRHVLVSIRRLSAELRRQEVAIWKKVIRVIAHELNNSLTPVRSMVHSARLIRQQNTDDSRLDEILQHIDDSAAGMHRFVDGYRRFARMPEPRLETISLEALLAPLHEAEVYTFETPDPSDSSTGSIALEVDPGQARQALLNLLKNSRQAGSPPEEVVIRTEPGADGFLWLKVLDRGTGMDEQTFSKALLPFYSSKKDGTGLGLALVREIVEAHGGRVGIALRRGGGLEVTCSWPLASRRRSTSAR